MVEWMEETQNISITAKNPVISRNFLVWKFCEKAQFPHSLWANLAKLCRNCAFLQNFHTRKLREITGVFCSYFWPKNSLIWTNNENFSLFRWVLIWLYNILKFLIRKIALVYSKTKKERQVRKLKFLDWNS